MTQPFHFQIDKQVNRYMERKKRDIYVTSKGSENICPHNNLYTNVHDSIIHVSQEVEATQMSIN